MPDFSNERIREIEAKLGNFVFEDNDETHDGGLAPKGPYQLSSGAIY
jgi:hypothetical protein